MTGKEKCRQSLPDPCRTNIALVNAANVIVTADNAIQTPVLGAGDSRCATRCNSGGGAILAGGSKVVAINACVAAALQARRCVIKSASCPVSQLLSAPTNSA